MAAHTGELKYVYADLSSNESLPHCFFYWIPTFYFNPI